MTETTAPINEPLYIGEQTLDTDIRKYLVHLASLAKTPITLNVHGRPQSAAIDIHTALYAHEQQLMSRKEEICAHEMTDPHNAASIGAGRRELSDLIAGIALPLASNTWANEVYIDLQIGHGLPSPHAPDGMAVCIVFDCKHGIVRQRFAPQLENCAPACESEVTLGMTVVCRPGKIGANQMQDVGDPAQLMGLLQSDAALFGWTLYTLLIIANLQQSIEFKMGEEQQLIMNQARGTMLAVLLAIRVKRDQDAAISALGDSDQQTAPVTMPPIDQVRQALQSIKRVSPKLGLAIERLEQTLERLIPAVQAHSVAHNQLAAAEHAAAKETMREPHPTHHAPHQPGHLPSPEPEEN